MPSYSHICTDTECNHEWDDFYSISQDPPKICPACNKETAKRVISSGGTRGVVELYGSELVDKIKEDVRNIKKDMHKSEKVYSNMLGEQRYDQLQTKMDQQKRIKRSK